MNIFKYILKKLLKKIFIKIFTILLIASVALNIILFKSSYGSLIFKRNDDLLNRMLSVSFDKYSNFYEQKDTSYKINYQSVNKEGKQSSSEIKLYFDKDSKLTYSITDINIEGKVTKYYYSDNFIYTEYSDGNKVKEEYSTDSYPQIDNMLMFIKNYISYEKLITDDTKTGVSFSFSPFYVIGIKVKGDNVTTHYDLKGNLRKITTIENENKITVKISKNSNKIKLPDLNNFIKEA